MLQEGGGKLKSNLSKFHENSIFLSRVFPTIHIIHIYIYNINNIEYSSPLCQTPLQSQMVSLHRCTPCSQYSPWRVCWNYPAGTLFSYRLLKTELKPSRALCCRTVLVTSPCWPHKSWSHTIIDGRIKMRENLAQLDPSQSSLSDCQQVCPYTLSFLKIQITNCSIKTRIGNLV